MSSNIASLLLRCDQLLIDELSNGKLDSYLHSELDDIQTRLKIWAGESGAFAQGDDFLGYRLRGDPKAAELLVDMLVRLEDAIQRALKKQHEGLEAENINEGERNLSLDTETQSSESSTSTMALDSDCENEPLGDEHKPKLNIFGLGPIEEVKRITDRMYRLSALFFDPDQEERVKVRKFISTKEANGETGEIADITDNAETWLRHHCKAISESLGKRLLKAAVFRRMKLLYRQQQQKEVESARGSKTGIEDSKQPVPNTDSGYGSSGSVRTGSGRSVPEVTDLGRSVEDPDSSPSCLDTTHDHVFPGQHSTQASAYIVHGSPAPSTYSARQRRRGLDIPALGALCIACPYCFKRIKEKERSGDAWTRHVLRDLEPYVCIFEECGEGDRLFRSTTDWLRHMQWNHTLIWQCPVSEHENEMFGSPDLLKAHLRSIDTDTLGSDELDHIVRRCKIPALDTFAALAYNSPSDATSSHKLAYYQCPLCRKKLQPGANPNEKDIRTHILRHLEKLAVRSLPAPMDGINEEDEEDQEVGGAGDVSNEDGFHHYISDASSDYGSAHGSLPAQLSDIDQENEESAGNEDNPDDVNSQDNDILSESFSEPNFNVLDRNLAVQAMGPGFDAIRGTGIPPLPEIRLEPENGVSKSISHPGSDVSTESTDRPTISDRGESLYSEIIANEPSRQQQLRQDTTTAEKEDDDSTSTLLEKLSLLRCRSKTEDGPYFFPRGLVEPLITERAVFEAIEEERHKLEKILQRPITDSMIVEYAELVCHSGYRKMFAILVMLERGWEIALFVNEKVSDNDLPLLAWPVDSSGRLVEMRRKEAPDRPLACCQKWTPRTHEDFDKEQWGLISPFFDKGRLRRAHVYDLSKKDILPWTKADSKVNQRGSVSISRIQIHPNHHNFERNILSNGSFAVKHFTSTRYDTKSPVDTVVPDHSYGPSPPGLAPPTSRTATSVSPQDLKKEFEREVEIMNRFSGDDHPHLISLLAAYRHGNEYCLLFRWGECDLKAFWEHTEPGSALDKSNLLWMMEQCRGIASGLQRIHVYQTTDSRTQDNRLGDGRIFGRHGDIKPENILLFRNQNYPDDRGTLVITDFGLNKFHHDDTKTFFSAREDPPTLAYQPPECDMDGCKITRSFDIWSFGCVLLEFITWQLGGWELVQTFVQFRKALNILLFGWKTDHFYEMVKHQDPEILQPGSVLVRVKVEVYEFVNQLHAHPDCSETFHDLLNFIIDNMLVIESVNLGHRAPCILVYEKLDDLYNRLLTTDYVVKADPWKKPKLVAPEAVEMPLNQEGARILSLRYYELKLHTGKTKRITSGGGPGVLLRRAETAD